MPDPSQEAEPTPTPVVENGATPPVRPGLGGRAMGFVVCTLLLRHFLAVHAAVIGLLIGSGALTDREAFIRGALGAGLAGAAFGLLLGLTGRRLPLGEKNFPVKELPRVVGACCLWF